MQIPNDVDESTLSIEAKGKLGEADFKAWLRAWNLGYMRVDQSADGFSPTFKDRIKRPDFLVPVELIGTLAVDVKNRRPQNNGSFTFPLGSELELAENYEHMFGHHFWYAYRIRESGKPPVWYWINVHKVAELAQSAKHDAEYLEIELHHFERIETANDLTKLFTHMRRRGKVIASGARPAGTRRNTVPA